MILTRTFLNIRRAGARKLLGSPQAMHAAILSGFAPGVEAGRALWRVDQGDPLRPTLYALTRETPDFTHLEEQAGWPSQPTTKSSSYQKLLDSLEDGQEWAFRLKANPTHRALIDGVSRIVGHVTVAQQTGWLYQRRDSLGADFGAEEEPTFALTGRQVLRFKRQNATVTLSVAQFDGILKVTDADRLRSSLTEGVGRAKAYGCGLMTLVRP